MDGAATPEPRQGPRPLALHLAIASWTWTSSLAVWPMARAGWQPWHPGIQTRVRAVLEDAERIAPSVFAEALNRVALARLGNFLTALDRYRRHPYRRAVPPVPVIWEEGSSRLFDYGGAGTPVLFVPSLVNRAYVLDLSERRSLMRHLARAGRHVLLLDWGEPGPTERSFGLTEYVERLARALHAASPRAPLDLAGYCMGGNLALAGALRVPETVRRLVLLATPWDFHAETSPAATALGRPGSPLLALAEAMGHLPVDALQTLFVSLDPLLAARKFSAFGRLPEGSREEEDFVAIEDWLNDGVPLTANVARDCLMGWYGENLPVRGSWRVARTTIDPAAVTCPTLVVIPDRDRIVPPASARALAEALPSGKRTVMSPAAGHIGMVVGSRAETALWQPLATWLADMRT
ncbi:MAG: alpha/beta fold hydrolase [Alphaproteobacteria bacterium]|nr:alpha/beta fold hydrolase [Alphaproteobacteria bacterium]